MVAMLSAVWIAVFDRYVILDARCVDMSFDIKYLIYDDYDKP